MTPDESIGPLARSLAEVAHTMESADDADGRIRRSLNILSQFVPYRRCALLTKTVGLEAQLVVLPEQRPADRQTLSATMNATFELITESGAFKRPTHEEPHLSLPVIGMDRVIGLLRVDPADGTTYDGYHLRLLSVVAAQLGAYLAMLALREADERRRREIEEAHDMQRLLAGVVSHDLRNPVAVIKAVVSSLRRRDTDEQTANAMDRIDTSARRAERIIDDLLLTTRLRTGGALPMSPRRVNFADLVKDLVEDLQLAHADRRIDLTSRTNGPVEGIWDPERLVQAFVNLISNALVHGDRQSPVRVEVYADASEVSFSVHNTGRPIPAGAVGGLFDPFRRGRAEPDAAGLGLGLYVVDQVVRAHAGEIEVLSNATDGTTFRVTLPRTPPPSSH